MLTMGAAMKMGSRRKLRAQPDVWRAQLMCIDGVSADKAAALAREVPSAAALMQLWQRARVKVEEADDAQGGGERKKMGKTSRKRKTDTDDPVDLALKDVVVNDKKGTTVGPALSKRIRVAMTEAVDEDKK